MKNLKAIRERLNLSQAELGTVMDCSQGNVGFCERDEQPLMPERAIRLIEYAATQGLVLTMDMVYDRAPLPPEPTTQASAA